MDRKAEVPIKKMVLFALGLIVLLGIVAYLYWGRSSGPEPTVGKAPGPVEGVGPAVTVVPQMPAQPPAAADRCQENREKLQGLFAYLDRQDYIVSRQLRGGSFEHFKRLTNRLLAAPPLVQRETDDLLRVLQNKAHFFRVLGREDASLLREVLRKEGPMMESSFAILYQALQLQDQCAAEDPHVHVPLERIYPYAVFFLNTMGGASYLMRRDARVRTLTRYYAILLIDEANRQKKNKLGLDLRPALDLLVTDLKEAANLERKDEYLDALKAIRARY